MDIKRMQEKIFDTIQYTRNRRNFPQLEKDYLQKPTPKIKLNVEKLKAF